MGGQYWTYNNYNNIEIDSKPNIVIEIESNKYFLTSSVV